ncbi:MAG: N-acetylglucosamine-6-phosphate deacetylase [Alphaproteobacteria bacterium]
MAIWVRAGGGVFDGEHLLADHAAYVDGGIVARIAPIEDISQRARLLGPGVISAGFVDLQVNGGAGTVFNDSPTVEGLARISAAHRAGGALSILPTFITDSADRRDHAIQAVAQAMAEGVQGIAGLHLEGPYLNPARRGAHRQEHIQTLDHDAIEALIACPIRPLLVTLAPEMVPKGSIARLVEAGIIVFAGHSEACAERMALAEAEGLRGVTHLYNAMSQLQGRAPGLVGSCFASRKLSASVIADGHHVATASLQAAVQAMGPDRLLLVSDAMTTGVHGYTLYGERIEVRNGACINAEGNLAGAALTLDQAVGHMVEKAGLPIELALRMATSRPAAMIGLSRPHGHLPGPGIYLGPDWQATPLADLGLDG